MSACKGETADLDLTGTLPLNFLPWIKFLKRHFGFCWLPWWFFPPWRANIERQIPSGIPAPLRGEVMRSTPQFLQLHLQDKPKAVFCLTAFGTSIIQCPCQPAACLGGLLTNTAYLKHLFFFFSQTSFTSSHTGFTAHSAALTGSSAAALIFLGVFPYLGLGLPSSGNGQVFHQLPPQL